MNYATGYALNAKEIVNPFKYKRLQMTPKECEELIGNRNRELIVESIFKYSIKLVLNDIIHNGYSFKLPISKECILFMKEYYDEEFIKCRKRGKWMNVDFYNSNYTAYQLTFRYPTSGVTIDKPVYCNVEYRDSIINYVNSGKAYHDGKVKTINDYFEQLYQEFPKIKKGDIRVMIKFAWRMLYLCNYNRCDTVVSSTKYDFWFLIGSLTRNSVTHYNYYKHRMKSKIRFLYKQKKRVWDGYYYFGLHRDEYEEYKSQIKSVGRKKKWFVFKKKVLFKIQDEANLNYDGAVCIMRIIPPTHLGYSYYKEELKCAYPEIVMEREPLKLKDILVTSNNYKYI